MARSDGWIPASGDRKEQEDFARSPYFQTLKELVKGACVPFNIFVPGRPVVANGTLTFVDTGERKIAITAYHVYERFLMERAQRSSANIQAGAAYFDPEKYIDGNKEVDIATFEATDQLVAAAGLTAFDAGRSEAELLEMKHHFHAALIWPPPLPRENEWVLMGGWPGALRDEEYRRTNPACWFFFSKVTRVEADKITVVLNLAGGIDDGSVRGPVDTRLGGISGGPVFGLVARDGSEFRVPQIVGTIAQCSDNSQITYVSPLSIVQPDGCLGSN